MDQIKIGKFIAELRKKEGLTQEALGERLGVTNKTVSRWENGNYMPDIEMLQLLAQEFQVTIHELLCGERLRDEVFKKKADETIIAVAKASAFSFEERKAYYKKKWRKEHIPLFVILWGTVLALLVLPFALGKPYLISIAPTVGLVGHAYFRNKMMIYVEHKLYDCAAAHPGKPASSLERKYESR